MSNVQQELIEAATRKGIVPGAVVRCAYITSNTFTVPHWDEIEGEANISTVSFVDVYKDGGSKQRNYGYLKFNNTWATVITPAPSQGLEEGMATECSPAMRAAIIELAKELGVNVWGDTARNNDDPVLIFHDGEIIGCFRDDRDIKASYTPEDFIAKMRATAKKLPKRETINGHDVTFHKGSVYLPCSQYTNETVRAIAANLKD